MSKNTQYARISDYGDIIVPLSLMEKFASECKIVKTSWIDGEDVITEINDIKRVVIHNEKEIEDAIVQMKLQEAN